MFGKEFSGKCLETRTDKNGLRHRRYLTGDGRTNRTVELPAEVAKMWLNCKRFQERLEKWQRAQERDRLFLLAQARRDDGYNAAEISKQIGIPERTVFGWLRQSTRRKHMKVKLA
jgi:hypothetical protein